MYYDWGRGYYGNWPTLHLKIELNAMRARERWLDFHVVRGNEPDALDAVQDILRERGERFLPVVRARPPRWFR